MEYHDVTRSEGGKGEGCSGSARPSKATDSHEITPKYENEPDIEEDREKGRVTKLGDSSSEELPRKSVSDEDLRNEEELENEPGVSKTYWRRYRALGHTIIWLLVTAYDLMKNLLSTAGGSVDLCYIATDGSSQLSSTSPSLSGSSLLMSPFGSLQSTSLPLPLLTRRPVYGIWSWIANHFSNAVPEKLHVPLGFALVIAVVIITTFASPTTVDNSYKNRGISIAGLFVFYLVLYITSANRKKIVWRTVLVGLLCQFLLALFVLRSQAGYDIFNFISFLARYPLPPSQI